MIFFQMKPDAIFTEILTGALEIHVDLFREFTGSWGPQEWGDGFPLSSRCFTGEAAASEVRKLLDASLDSTCYRVTDYHWLLLFECLESYCGLLNDSLADPDCELGDSLARLGIREIDFEGLVEAYFWDTDFLMHPKVLEGIRATGRESLGVSEHALGIAEGWAPHPEELKLEPVDPREHWDSIEPSPLYRPGCRRYPDLGSPP
jgi:hypothetical protein